MQPIRAGLLIGVVMLLLVGCSEMIKVPSPGSRPNDQGPEPPRIIYFSANSQSVIAGDSVNLRWETANAESVRISEIGTVEKSGQRKIDVHKATTYILTAKNAAGEVDERVSISVGIPKTVSPETPETVCHNLVQGKIAWDYKGSRQWGLTNLQRLCRGTSDGSQPPACFNRVMHGGINWGGGTQWKWENAIDLCEGTNNAAQTIACFQSRMNAKQSWQSAVSGCSK